PFPQFPYLNCIDASSTKPTATMTRSTTAQSPAPCSRWTIASSRNPNPIDRYHQPQRFDWKPRMLPFSMPAFHGTGLHQRTGVGVIQGVALFNGHGGHLCRQLQLVERATARQFEPVSHPKLMEQSEQVYFD